MKSTVVTAVATAPASTSANTVEPLLSAVSKLPLVAAVASVLARLSPVVDPSAPAVNSKRYTTCAPLLCKLRSAPRSSCRRLDDNTVQPVPSAEQTFSITIIDFLSPTMFRDDTNALTNAACAVASDAKVEALTFASNCVTSTVTTERSTFVGTAEGFPDG